MENQIISHYFFAQALEELKSKAIDYNAIFDIAEDDFLRMLIPFTAQIEKVFEQSELTSLGLCELIPALARMALANVVYAHLASTSPHCDSYYNYCCAAMGVAVDIPFIVMGRIEGEEDEVLEVFAKNNSDAEAKFTAYLKETDTFIQEVERRKDMGDTGEEAEPDTYIEFCKPYKEMRALSLS
ncbi:hypothetical protein [Pseudoalteromonas lipolytica]|uniref:hypothetical protein n=1 Tax=Pseudoalteromonas lipolytica TaxID=570156 RepID=UPI0030B25321